MGYCFMTLEKIKNFNQMNAKYRHNYREMEVINADPEKACLNDEPVSLEGKTYKEAFKGRVEERGYALTDKEAEKKGLKKIRSNAVLGFEVVTTFSREDAEHIDLEKWKEDNVKWLRETFNADPDKYGDNVLSVVYHADEPGNVHCHAFIVPIDDKGNLNARYYVQNRQKMVDMQDSYAELMKKEHNLERGIHGTKARHQDIKRYYASLNAALDKDLPEVKENETASEYRERVNEVYKDASVKTFALENKMDSLSKSYDQRVKNEVSAAKKELYDRYQQKADDMDELVRENGSREVIKEKCSAMDNLMKGIDTAEPEVKDDYIAIVSELMEEGKREREKERKAAEKAKGKG